MVIKMSEEILPYKCNCGGTLKKSHTQVEFFGIDFGIRKCEVCTKCNSEYLDDEVLNEIEKEVKERKLFGVEKEVEITKSGNSLVIRLPPQIVKFTKAHYKDRVRIYPTGKSKISMGRLPTR